MNQFDDMDDPLSDLWSGKPAEKPMTRPAPNFTPAIERAFFEPCGKCRGTGMTPWGVCFRCKGTKGKTFKTNPQTRAANRERVQAKAAEKATQLAQEAQAWAEQHKAEVQWLAAACVRQEQLRNQGKPTWDFPNSLLESISKWGRLTEGQLAAVRKCMIKDEERKAAREAAQVEIDASKITGAFAKARAAAAADDEGVKWLHLFLDTFTFSDAPARGQWPAAVFVKEGDIKLGRIVAGRFVRSQHCTDEQAARIAEVAADPAKAAKAYGQRWTTCACCGRELTNKVSREMGIGPICAQKFGF